MHELVKVDCFLEWEDTLTRQTLQQKVRQTVDLNNGQWSKYKICGRKIKCSCRSIVSRNYAYFKIFNLNWLLRGLGRPLRLVTLSKVRWSILDRINIIISSSKQIICLILQKNYQYSVLSSRVTQIKWGEGAQSNYSNFRNGAPYF